MNEGKKRLLLAAAMGWVLPAALLLSWKPEAGRGAAETEPLPTAEYRQETESPQDEKRIRVLEEDGTVREMELEDYVAGVVAAEMPASFESEALKAQAVVARTYTLRRCDVQRKHDTCDVCQNPACCQGYAEQERISQEAWEKIRKAVAETAGEVLTYNGDLAEATYFSSSGGSTEDAEAVWGADVPYLKATDSPGEQEVYRESLFFSRQELESRLGILLEGDASDWIWDITYTAGGGVDTLDLSGNSFRGTEIRKLLGLNSTCFTLVPMGDGLSFSTVGFGHRVGMSQYGADAMAVSGGDYREILAHYYAGTEVMNRKDLDFSS